MITGPPPKFHGLRDILDARCTRCIPSPPRRGSSSRRLGQRRPGGAWPMRPTLQARGLKESLLQYLSTTYALSDEGARESLHRFFGDEDSGMFRGPFLRIRTPFTVADESWRELLDWRREGWTPHAHQAAAFARLSSAGGRTP